MTDADRLLAAHRALLADADRLVRRAEHLAGAAALGPLVAEVLASAVHTWSSAVRAHDGTLVASLPADLRDDRAALVPALDRLHVTADALAARPDKDTATALAVELAELRDLLREHLDDERAVLAVSRPRA